MTIDDRDVPTARVGEACQGGTVVRTEAGRAGSFRKPTDLGDRRIAARILEDGCGSPNQQHGLTMQVIAGARRGSGPLSRRPARPVGLPAGR